MLAISLRYAELLCVRATVIVDRQLELEVIDVVAVLAHKLEKWAQDCFALHPEQLALPPLGRHRSRKSLLF